MKTKLNIGDTAYIIEKGIIICGEVRRIYISEARGIVYDCIGSGKVLPEKILYKDKRDALAHLIKMNNDQNKIYQDEIDKMNKEEKVENRSNDDKHYCPECSKDVEVEIDDMCNEMRCIHCDMLLAGGEC